MLRCAKDSLLMDSLLKEYLTKHAEVPVGILPAALPVQAIKIISKSITETVEHCHHTKPATPVR